MKSRTWAKKIREDMEKSGTYQPFFSGVIDTLARILEQRDAAIKEFEDSGAQAVIEHTNRFGATNLVKNPRLQSIRELNRLARSYIRELGLTPAAYKQIATTRPPQSGKDALSGLINALDGQ